MALRGHSLPYLSNGGMGGINYAVFRGDWRSISNHLFALSRAALRGGPGCTSVGIGLRANVGSPTADVLRAARGDISRPARGRDRRRQHSQAVVVGTTHHLMGEPARGIRNWLGAYCVDHAGMVFGVKSESPGVVSGEKTAAD